ncbi:hypothetical protein RI065_07360 [Mycoplasmatota bacterium zrk1]
MLKYIMIIGAISIYEMYMMAKKRQMKDFNAFLIFVLIALLASYIHVHDPFDASLSELLLKLVKSEYFKGG